MKRIAVFLCVLNFTINGVAQSFNNEWIDYNKTYFKFKIGVTGVYQIVQPALASIGLGNTAAEHFQLWRKWDGTDQYGQKLASGVYLCRVVTNLNGKSLDKYKAEGDVTDKYFNKGYGKMYLMR